MNPKISDFGLARIFKQDDSEANTNMCVGTRGYMTPEYVMQGMFSVKSDAWELWRKNSALELMDPTLSNSCIIEQVLRCIHIGLLWIEDVVSMLKNESKSLGMPTSPAFITRNNVLKEQRSQQTKSQMLMKSQFLRWREDRAQNKLKGHRHAMLIIQLN
ncbi:hypothetical protein ACS0TY_011899 [Phlomoides rotata]